MSAERPRSFLLNPFLLLTLFTLLLHSSALRNGFVYDDMSLIAENTFVHSLSNLPKVFQREYLTDRSELDNRGSSQIGSGEATYRPVRTLIYFFFARLFGLFAPAWHLTSLLFHALNACLLFLFVRRLTGQEEAAYYSALLFAAHPVTVEAVHVVSFDADLISTGLCLGSLLLYLRFREAGGARSYAGSLALFFLACFTKEPAVTLPVMIVLHDWLFWAGGNPRLLSERWRAYAGYLLVLLFYFWARFVWMYDPLTPIAYEGHWSGIVRVLGISLSTLIFPANIHPTFPGDPKITSPYLEDATFILSAILLPALLYIAWRVRRRSPHLSFGIFWFFIALLPALGLLRAIVAYRYLYFPTAGFLVPLAVLLGCALSRPKWARRAQVAFLAVLTCFAVLTGLAGLPWRSNDTLFREAIIRYPQLPASYYSLAGRYYTEGRFKEAIPLYEKALKLNPYFAKVCVYLGLCRQWEGKNDQAMALYDRALEIKPDFPDALVYKALLTDDPKEEMGLYHQALRLDPRSYIAWHALGIHYALNRDFDRAEWCWKRSFAINPDFEPARASLASLKLMREEEEAPRGA